MKNIKNWLIYKLFREIKNFCSILTCRVITIVKNHYYDKYLGIETNEEYYSSKDNVKNLFSDAEIYQAIPYQSLIKIIRYLKLKDNDVFMTLALVKGESSSLCQLKK